MTNHLSKTPQPVVVIAGPTASGKSALALDVAEAFDGVIINADSMQVYDKMRIVTARPSATEEARVAHKLYGIVDPAVAYSTGDWLDAVLPEIKTCWRSEKLPVVTGGTGLYLKALMDGLSDLPEIPAPIREATRAEVARLGPAKAHDLLHQKDSEMAARIPATDPQRISRALEVLAATGLSLAEHQRRSKPIPPLNARFQVFVVEPPREVLYARCDARFDWMLHHGALEEIQALDALSLDPDLPAMKALGVPELLAHVRGESDLETAKAQAQQATRRFAKRQSTWFRNQLSTFDSVSEQYSESLREKIFSKIREFLLT